MGEHAGGIIFVDEPFTNITALMRVPNGDLVTQFDLHDSEEVSAIKIDLLSVEGLDKIHNCLNLLKDNGFIEEKATLRETYESVIGVYNLEREAPEMWEMVWNHEIQALFQMEKQSGIQGIALTHPKSVDDLAVLNSVIRLMAQEKGQEQPLNKYARFKNDITQWYQEMTDYGLTEEEQKLLEPVVGLSYGIAESQEKIMTLVQMPECGGFDLSWADSLRKAVAKKNPEAYIKLQDEYFAAAAQKGLSQKLCNYVWNVLVAMSRGYSFNLSHTLAYSIVALQEMNLAYRYPIIFWNTACLITDSGGAEDTDAEGKNNNYDKIAIAIGKMTSEGIKVVPPNINKSGYTFTPDVENNQIIFGLRGLLNVGEDVIYETIKNRPYTSPKDYLYKVKPKKQAMISLIKAGAFDEMIDRKICMAWYIWETCDKKSRLTLQNLPSLIKNNLLDESTPEKVIARRVYEFNRYLKANCKAGDYYETDARSMNFLDEIGAIDLVDSSYKMNAKDWDKIYQKYMDVFRDWINSDKENILNTLNTEIFRQAWEKDASGTISAWEMESMCYYYHDHEMINVDFDRYGIHNFFDLPTVPVIEKSFKKGDKVINMFKLTKIAGTCIAKDKAKGLVTLLTPNGVVNVKFRKEYFAMFDKQISIRNPDGTKSVIERSWFNRGNMIMVQGVRIDDLFVPKKYASSGGHQLYRITTLNPDGTLTLQEERAQGEVEDE